MRIAISVCSHGRGDHNIQAVIEAMLRIPRQLVDQRETT